MRGSTLVLGISRVLQFHLAAAVFSLSIAIINWTYACNNDTNCASDVSPILNGTAQFEYGAFVGAFGLFDAVVGKTAIFVGAIPPLVTPVLDGLASILYLAGGIKVAAWLDMVHWDRYHDGALKWNPAAAMDADSSLMFLGCFITLVLMAVSFMWRRGGGGNKHSE